jgi:arylsulfatase A-like enzyme
VRDRITFWLRLAAVGAGIGLALAARELAQQRYLADGLWRTALWDAGRDSVGGAVAALAAGAVLLGVISLSRRVARVEGAASFGERGRHYVVLVVLLTGLAVLVSPQHGGHGVGIPYRTLLPLSYAVMCLALAAAVGFAGKRLSSDEDNALFRLQWLSVMGFSFVAAFLHLWARGFRPVWLGTFSAGALAACIVGYFLLAAPARLAHDRLGLPAARLLGGRLGWTLSALALVGSVALGMGGWIVSVRTGATARAGGRNVVLIGIDTLRADRTNLLSAGERDLTPRLRALAARGKTFTNTIAQSSWTLPSFASIFTGLYPEQHGAEHLTSTLAPAQVTLAELLREAGYHTMSVVSCEYLNAASGMGQGFEVLDESQVLGHRAVTSQEITDRAIELLESNRDRPFFLFAHYFDPHFCYEDHREYTFADWYRGWLREAVQNADQNAFCWMIGALGPAFASRSKATAEDRKFLADSYDEEVAYTDAQVGRLLDYLERRKLWDSTMVIVVGDHGEELLERNYSGHSTTLYREQVDVPLVLAAPGVEPHSVEPRTAEVRAIFPTILQFLGASGSRRMASQESLLAPGPQPAVARSSTRPVADPPGPGQFVPKYVWLTCITDGRWKLIKDHLHRRAALFDLLGDPAEKHDCSAAEPARRREFERALDGLDARVSGGRSTRPGIEVSEEQKRRLKALGYL